MAVFPSIAPIFDAQKNSAPVIKQISFGDGYEQRIKFGINQNPKEWSLTFMVKTQDADIIEAFLDARADDAASFDWTPPGSATSYKWVCFQWSRQYISDSFYQIQATFRQVFEP